jgi:hypothetical protein
VDRSVLCDHGFARRLGASGGLRRDLEIKAVLRPARIQRRAHFSYNSTREELCDVLTRRRCLSCPRRLLGELHHANDRFIPGFVSTLAPDIRASLALFCYRRNHLHSMGLAIAASCNEADLVREGGGAGAFLFTCSKKLSREQALSSRVGRRKVTLSTGVLRVFAIDDEPQAERPAP